MNAIGYWSSAAGKKKELFWRKKTWLAEEHNAEFPSFIYHSMVFIFTQVGIWNKISLYVAKLFAVEAAALSSLGS